MAESSQVRLLQNHLRQAGTSLAARQYDAASTHIEAALAIDPASLAALTLRERLEAQRTQLPPLDAKPLPPRVAEPATPETKRFVPAGVNAASWLDFEQRIQERRFRALLETTERAVAAGDGVAARAAIEEARELQPDSGEVARLSARIAMLQLPAVAAKEGFFRSRTFRAASFLLLGVTLLMGLDWVRSGAKPADGQQIASTAAAPEAFVAEPKDTTTAPTAEGTTGSSPERLPLTYRSVTTPPAAAPRVDPPPVVVARAPATPDLADNDPTRTPGGLSASPIVRGEVSDDYVAPRREVRQNAPERGQPTPAPSVPVRPAVTTTPLANVVRQPAPILESITAPAPAAAASPATIPVPSVTAPITPSVPATTAAAAVAPTRVSEDSRVAAVLNQYASAYGQLNAAAVRSIWPSVDERALARAFSNLSSQSMSFDNCDVNITGATARASCHGRASYIVKVGSQEKHDEPRTVRFELKRDGEAWKIVKAETSR